VLIVPCCLNCKNVGLILGSIAMDIVCFHARLDTGDYWQWVICAGLGYRGVLKDCYLLPVGILGNIVSVLFVLVGVLGSTESGVIYVSLSIG